MKNIYRLWYYFKKYKIAITVAMIASAIVASTDAAIVYLSKDVLDKIFIAKDTRMLKLLPFAIMSLFIVRLISTFFQSYLIKSTAQKAIQQIRNDMYYKMIRLPMSYYDNNELGTMMTKVISDVSNLQSAVSSALNVFRSVLSVIFLTGVVFYQDFTMALSVFLIIPILMIIIKKSGKKMKKHSAKSQEQLGFVGFILNESFSGIRVVKAFINEAKEFNRFKLASVKEMKYRLKQAVVSSVSSPLIETMSGFGVALIIFYGGFKVISGETTPGTFFSFLTAFGFMFEPFKKINNYNNLLQKASASADRIFSVLDCENDIIDNNGSLKCEAAKKDIRFDNVSFRYSEDGPDVLKNINLTLEHGKSTAIVGHSGSGKSTLASLLSRLYDVTDGKITINDIDIKDFDVYSLRRNIGVVTQHPFLFNNTIMYNIAYGSDTEDMEKIKEAAKHAYALDFIEAMPDKFDTLVGEMGVMLSGGQKQRITISRAILMDPPILVLDEATSALDMKSEHIVQKALEELVKKKTSIIIAHRLSTVINADKIVVLHKGEIVAAGTHIELLEKSDIYSKMVLPQLV